MKLTDKQLEIYIEYTKKQPSILFLHGAIRTGKTVLLVILFVEYVLQHKNKLFLILGYTKSTLKTNVLDVIEEIFNVEITISPDNTFSLFGNKIKVAGADKSHAFKNIRGLTAQGALGNEATLWHTNSYNEMIARCSEPNARIFIDTNPANPKHYLKKQLIDNKKKQYADGSCYILDFSFNIQDNSKKNGGFLTEKYVEGLIKSTPNGFRYARIIDGLWTSAENAVFTEFSEANIIKKAGMPPYFYRTWVGEDFGFVHKNVKLFVGEYEGIIYVFKSLSGTQKTNKYWIDRQKELAINKDVEVQYCDSARPDFIDELRENAIPAIMADKKVNAGIDKIQQLFKEKKLFILDELSDLIEELYNYEYMEKDAKEVVKKKNDDYVDALRYAIYSDYLNNFEQGSDFEEETDYDENLINNY